MDTHEPTPITPEDVTRVARLARLELSGDVCAAFCTQLDAVLKHVESMRRLPLEGVEPMPYPLDLHSVLDEDTPGDPLPNEALMKMAPESAPPFIKVPKVIDSGGSA